MEPKIPQPLKLKKEKGKGVKRGHQKGSGLLLAFKMAKD